MRAATFRRPALLVCAFVILAVFAAPAAAATFSPDIFEDPIGPVPGANCTPPAAIKGCSLRSAIAAAHSGDTIQLQVGTYKLAAAGELAIEKQLTILGAGPGATTIEAGTGNQASRVIGVKNGVALAITGVTITGGEVIGADGVDGTTAGAAGGEGHGVEGAGISTNGPLTLTDVDVTGNKLIGGNGGAGAAGGEHTGGAGGRGGFTDGAGIDAGGGLVTLDRVAITDNVAQPGAGGSGGNAGTGIGDGGAGGKGGSADGAGISAGGGSSIVATDTLIAGNLAETGAAGAGGVGGEAAQGRAERAAKAKRRMAVGSSPTGR